MSQQNIYRDLLSQINMLYRMMRRGQHRREGDQLARGQGRLIHVLSRYGREVSSGELAQRMEIRPSSMSEKLGRLEQEGLIVRRPDPDDSRRILVSLSDKGREIVQEHGEIREKMDLDMFSCLTEEEAEQFRLFCKKVCDHLEEQYPKGRGDHHHDSHHHHGRDEQ